MRCCVGPQNPSVANDISERAVTVVICFSFSTCCCPCKTSDTATLLAHPKLPVVARIWHVYTYSRTWGRAEQSAAQTNVLATGGRVILPGPKFGGSYTLFLLPILSCTLVVALAESFQLVLLLIIMWNAIIICTHTHAHIGRLITIPLTSLDALSLLSLHSKFA